MRVVILGAEGQLGQAFKYVASKFDEIELICCDAKLDIALTAQWLDFLDECSPDAVINCIAYNDVDLAESQSDRVCLVNGLALEPLAAWAEANQVFWVQFSSDYVFDGFSDTPYTEDDIPNPLGVYGYSKRIMENIFFMHNPPGLIIRTSWVFSLYGVNFLTRLLAKARTTKQINMLDDLVGSPTMALDLAEIVLKLVITAKNDTMQVFHISNRGDASWYDLVVEVNKLWDLGLEVTPQSLEEFSSGRNFAPRPKYSVLDVSKAEAFLGEPIRDWREALVDLANCKGQV